jgi:hypothetical protein
MYNMSIKSNNLISELQLMVDDIGKWETQPHKVSVSPMVKCIKNKTMDKFTILLEILKSQDIRIKKMENIILHNNLVL